jgi:hypothetical protein
MDEEDATIFNRNGPPNEGGGGEEEEELYSGGGFSVHAIHAITYT